MAKQKQVAVVGAGIIGLTSALEFSRLPEVSVTVFDPKPGLGATYAAAGMVAPCAEARANEEESFQLQQSSLVAWAGLLNAIGLPGEELHRSGTLYVGWDASDRRQLEQLRSVIVSQGGHVESVSRDDRDDLFVGVHPSIRSGLFLPEDAWVNPDLVMERLLETLRTSGVEFEPEAVTGCGTDGSVSLLSGVRKFDAVLLATGAQSLGGDFPEFSNSVRPVRGVTAHLESTDAFKGPMIRAFVRGRDFYAVNRGDGIFIVGASSEERSEMGVELGEVERLFRDSLEVLPILEQSVLGEIRRGLRPASTTSDPFLERLEGSKIVFSSGHFRHGVTLSPVTARLSAVLMQEILNEN